MPSFATALVVASGCSASAAARRPVAWRSVWGNVRNAVITSACANILRVTLPCRSRRDSHASLKAELSPHHRQQIAFRVVNAHGAGRPVQVQNDRVGRQCRFEAATHRVAKRAVAVCVEPPAGRTGARRKDGYRGPVPFLKIGHAACQFTLAAQCPVTHFGAPTRHTPF